MTAPSAKGLFRASGNVAKVELSREADDFYPTPPEPLQVFLEAEIARLRCFPWVWEAAAGDGAMVRQMEAFDLTVKASDKIDRGCDAYIRDFFDFGLSGHGDAPALVTNPPYSECNWRDGRGRWVTHALETLKIPYMALLLSWSWPGAAGHGPMLVSWPPARVYLMRWKIDFTGQGAPPMLNGWFVWDAAHRGETVLRMLDRPKKGEIS